MIEALVERALARLPEPLRARYREEWQADLAALDGRRWAALRWALGLQRASIELRRVSGGKPQLVLPRLVVDAAALGLAYYAAYALRFGGQPPRAYGELLMQTLPFTVLGGLVCLALAGAYKTTGALSVVKGVGLATLNLVAYAAVVQPNLVSTSRGLEVLNVPAGVCVIFASTAVALMLLSRAAVKAVRA